MVRAVSWEKRAHDAAEAHIAACEAHELACDGLDVAEWPPSPASAPYCGCDTCIIRETLVAAWPVIFEAAKEELAREAG